MKLFIDAYNYLKQIHSSTYIDEQQRHAFVSLLCQYVRKKRYSLSAVSVVFDGGDYPYERIQRGSSITTVYAGYASSADEWLIDHAQCVRQAILVTSDNELRSRCAEWGWYSISSPDFFHILDSFTNTASAEYQGRSCVDNRIRRLNEHDEMTDFDKFMYQVAEYGVPVDTTQPENSPSFLEKQSKRDARVEKILKYLL